MTVCLALAQIAEVGDAEERVGRVLGAMREAKTGGADVIAFPELAGLPFFPQHEEFDSAASLAEPIPGPTAERISRAAKELGLVTVYNMYEVADGEYFDSSPVFDADGAHLGTTRMVHITDYVCFHERSYYTAGDRGAPVYDTAVCKLGVAICYDRHYPEYMRALGVGGAELVVIPQAGAVNEWPEGMYEAEVRTAAFQNGYFAALCNRVGEEKRLTFSGESFVVDPEGRVVARGKKLEEDLVLADLDLALCGSSPARSLFWRDRRPELYGHWLA
ncbi:MAG: carbon-nitrogen hydrolase family protein [Gemmatimonadales bacterium]